MLKFVFRVIAQWPSLAWIALCRVSDHTIEILHGTGVEITSDWFCEAVWAGPFEDGDFDNSDLVFGSGGRIRSSSAVFVSSSTTLDRLHSVELQECVLISNSLPCLMWFCHGHVDLNYTAYIRDFDTVVDGIERYKTALVTSVGSVQLTYHSNLEWNGQKLIVAKKKVLTRDFGDFAKYRQFLDDSLRRIAENMSAVSRKKRLSMIGTMSSGYDSPTVAALAKPHGLNEVFSFRTARGGDEDSGNRVAEALGIKLLLIDRDAWRANALPEVPFLATQASGGDVFFSGAADQYLSDRVLLTGFHGDKVWGTEHWEGANALARGDCSGSGLSEYRLSRSFIHVPLPFFAATQCTDIVNISRAPEMDPWRLSTWYDRPICRRILEEAGVPRTAFGMTKKAASVIFWQRGDFMTGESSKSCRRFLQVHGVRVRTLSSTIADVLAFALRVVGWLATFFPDRLLKGKVSIVRRTALKLISLGSGSDPMARSKWMPLTTNDRMFQHVFPWALDRAAKRYAGSFPFNDFAQATPTQEQGTPR